MWAPTWTCWAQAQQITNTANDKEKEPQLQRETEVQRFSVRGSRVVLFHEAV